MSDRHSFSVTLGVDQFEERICLSSGPHSDDSVIAVLQSTQGAGAVNQLLVQFQQGVALAKNLIQAQAGNDNFLHVVADAQFSREIAHNGAITSIQLEISSRCNAYAAGDTSQAAALTASFGRGALAAGFLRALADDYTTHAIADLSHLSSLGSGVVPGISTSIRSIDDSYSYIVGNIDTTVGHAGDDFGQPHEVHELEIEGADVSGNHGGGGT